MLDKKNSDFTQGNILRKLLLFMVPILGALVLQAVLKLARKGVVDIPTGVILVATFIAVAFLGISPVIMVVIAAAAGILLGLIRRRRV